MHPTTRFFLTTATLLLSACASQKDPGPIDTPTLTEAAPVPTAAEKSERFVIRDQQQRLRVDGRTNAGRMDGPWVYYDSKGEKLALVNYRLDQRNGPVQLYYVTADGPAVGRLRMTGKFAGGSAHGTVESRWASGGKKLERDFDRGILQGARGWTEKGTRMTDGEAMSAGIEESRAEEALLSELENFVQLQLRKKSAERGGRLPEVELELPPPIPPGSAPYQGGTASLANP
jgi:hypothetical protein